MKNNINNATPYHNWSLIVLENTTHFDFGRETWIKYYLKDYY